MCATRFYPKQGQNYPKFVTENTEEYEKLKELEWNKQNKVSA